MKTEQDHNNTKNKINLNNSVFYIIDYGFHLWKIQRDVIKMYRN